MPALSGVEGLHVGIKLPNWGDSASPATISAVAVAADRCGFDSLWVSDHIVTSSADHAGGLTTSTPFYEVLATLAFAGALTTRVQLATGVLVAPLRDALLLAKQAGTIDRLTGGRMVLGLGAGWLEEEFEALGKSWKGRGRTMSDGIALMRTAWKEREFTPGGVSVGMHPLPVTGTVPLLLGGRSPSALKRAATRADGWYGANMTADEVVEVSAVLSTMLPPGGRSTFQIGVKPARLAPADALATVDAYSECGLNFIVLDPDLEGLDADAMADAVATIAKDLALAGRLPRPLVAKAN